jgi:hypothetical protein
VLRQWEKNLDLCATSSASSGSDDSSPPALQRYRSSFWDDRKRARDERSVQTYMSPRAKAAFRQKGLRRTASSRTW